MIAGSNGNSVKSSRPEAAKYLSDLLAAEGPALELRHDAVMAYYSQVRAWARVVTGKANGFAIQTSNKRADSDGVGVGEGFPVSFAEVFFELIVPDWGVALVEQGKDCPGEVFGDGCECKNTRHSYYLFNEK